jgi:hypothetical protein
MNIHLVLSVFISSLSSLLASNTSRVPLLFFRVFLFLLTNTCGVLCEMLWFFFLQIHTV